MRFDTGIAGNYRRAVEDAFEAILERGDESHQRILRHVIGSQMTVCVFPVSRVMASGLAGVTDPARANRRIREGRMTLAEAFGEVFITIAEETIDSGGARGCEGTFIHEGRHAFDFAQTIASFSDAPVNPLSLFDPTRFELELEAHRTAADYLLRVGREEYLREGLDLMILEMRDGGPAVSDEGIRRRLQESYGLSADGNRGERVSEMFGLEIGD
jgi:hypothetical protein